MTFKYLDKNENLTANAWNITLVKHSSSLE